MWLGITLAVLIGLSALVTFRGRRLTGWVAALFSWRRRHKQTPSGPRRNRRSAQPRSSATMSRCVGKMTSWRR